MLLYHLYQCVGNIIQNHECREDDITYAYGGLYFFWSLDNIIIKKYMHAQIRAPHAKFRFEVLEKFGVETLHAEHKGDVMVGVHNLLLYLKM
jgi:agmatine/peptidylarginine deiminase